MQTACDLRDGFTYFITPRRKAAYRLNVPDGSDALDTCALQLWEPNCDASQRFTARRRACDGAWSFEPQCAQDRRVCADGKLKVPDDSDDDLFFHLEPVAGSASYCAIRCVVNDATWWRLTTAATQDFDPGSPPTAIEQAAREHRKDPRFHFFFSLVPEATGMHTAIYVTIPAVVHAAAAACSAALFALLLHNLAKGHIVLLGDAAAPPVHPECRVQKSLLVSLSASCVAVAFEKGAFTLGAAASLLASTKRAGLIDDVVAAGTKRLMVGAVTTGALGSMAFTAVDALIGFAAMPQQHLDGLWPVVTMWLLVIVLVFVNGISTTLMQFVTPSGQVKVVHAGQQSAELARIDASHAAVRSDAVAESMRRTPPPDRPSASTQTELAAPRDAAAERSASHSDVPPPTTPSRGRRCVDAARAFFASWTARPELPLLDQGLYKITTQHAPTLRLSVCGGRNANGVKLHLWEPCLAASQVFRAERHPQLGGDDRWAFVPQCCRDGGIFDSKRYIDTTGHAKRPCVCYNGDDERPNKNQLFRLKRVKGDPYHFLVENDANGAAWDIRALGGPGAKLETWKAHSGSNQAFCFIPWTWAGMLHDAAFTVATVAVHAASGICCALIVALVLFNVTAGYLRVHRDAPAADVGPLGMPNNSTRACDWTPASMSVGRSDLSALVVACLLVLASKVVYVSGSVLALFVAAQSGDGFIDAVVAAGSQRLVVGAIATGALFSSTFSAIDSLVVLHAEAARLQPGAYWPLLWLWSAVLAAPLLNAVSETLMQCVTPSGRAASDQNSSPLNAVVKRGSFEAQQ